MDREGDTLWTIWDRLQVKHLLVEGDRVNFSHSFLREEWDTWRTSFLDGLDTQKLRKVEKQVPCGFCFLVQGPNSRPWHHWLKCPLVAVGECRLCLHKDHKGDDCPQSWKNKKANRRFLNRCSVPGGSCYRCGGPNESGDCSLENFLLELWIGIWTLDKQRGFTFIKDLKQWGNPKVVHSLEKLDTWLDFGYCSLWSQFASGTPGNNSRTGWNMLLVVLICVCGISAAEIED